MFDFLNEKYTLKELFCGKTMSYGRGGEANIKKEIVYIDLDDTLSDESESINMGKNPYEKEFYINLKPIEGGIESVKKLSKFYDVHILSAPSTDNPNSWKEKVLWVKKHFGDLFNDKIIFSSDKSLLKGKILIDNDINNSNFKGEFIHFGSEKYPNWDSVLQHLIPKDKMREGGEINETNYFENTEGEFDIINQSEYDGIDVKEYVSAFGSRYKIKDGILYRASDHWGMMNSVKWNLKNSETIKHLYKKDLDNNLHGYSETIYGKIPFSEMKTIGEQLIVVEPQIRELIQKLNKEGHLALIVGGAVRDALLWIKPKDIDIEVYKISYNDLMEFLSKYGSVDLVGKKFGVIKFKPYNSELDYDFSIPRRENKIGIGHTEFEITFDENISVKDASTRRDFTMNAIGYDPIENKIYDYFGGVDDIKNGIIRHTSSAFKEDSLRILRAMGFQARFKFIIHPDTIALIREMLKTNDFDDLSKERIYEEWRKWAEKGVRHDLIFKFMRDTTLINKYPELKALKETPQDTIYHPEGDVEIHTTMTLTEMDRIINSNNIHGQEKVILVMSILLHDIGKPKTTKEELKRGRMTITSHGHEALGGEMVKEFLPRLGFHEELITPISNLVANHLAGVSISMIPNRSGQMKAVKKLSRRLYPATIQQLLYVMDADNYGRGGERKEATGKKELIALSAEADVQNKAYQPILMGRHLIEKGLQPSPKFREILQKSFEAQESGAFNDIGGAKRWLEDYLHENG